MDKVKPNGIEFEISPVCIGTAPYGSDLKVEKCYEVMDCFYEMGGNLIDTANFYANWLPVERSISEKTIGKWMYERNNRHDMIISTKGGHPLYETLDVPRLSKAEILYDIDDSLKNLKTDYVDIYFLHRDNEAVPVFEMIDALNTIIKSGKARSIGLSNWKPYRIEQAMKYCKDENLAEIKFSQIEFGLALPNYGAYDMTTEYMDFNAYEFYKKNKINTLSCSSQSGGYFFCNDDSGNPLFNKKFSNDRNLKMHKYIKSLCKKYDCSAASIIISALTSNQDFCTVPILGCMNAEQVKSSAGGLELRLEKDEIKKLLSRSV